MTQTPPPDWPSDMPGTAARGQVVTMAGHDRGRAGRILSGLRAHWFSLRAGRAVPDRVDITAAGLGPALDHAFILERIAPGAARLRLAGRHLIDLMGMEVRGMPFCALFNPGARGHLSDVVEAVFRGPQLADLVLRAPMVDGVGPHPGLAGRMLLMPLKSDLGDVTRILGCVVADAAPGHAPIRFDLISESFEPVMPGAPVLAPGEAPLAAPRSRRMAPETPPRVIPRPAPEAETGPRRRRFRSFGAPPDEGKPTHAAPEDTAPPGPWRPRLVIDNG